MENELKKNKQLKKLSLRKETVANLSNAEMTGINGGAGGTYSCDGCSGGTCGCGTQGGTCGSCAATCGGNSCGGTCGGSCRYC